MFVARAAAARDWVGDIVLTAHELELRVFELGDRIRESEDLHWLSHHVYLLGRTGEAIEAAAASVRLLEDAGPCPQLAWSLATMAGLAAFNFDPAFKTTNAATSSPYRSSGTPITAAEAIDGCV